MVTIFLQEGKHLKCQGLSSKTDDTKFFWLVQTSSKHKREMKHFGKASAFWFRVGGMSQSWCSEPWRCQSITGSSEAFCEQLTSLWECPESWNGSLSERLLWGSPKNVLTGVSVFYTVQRAKKAYANTPVVCFLVPASYLSFCPCSFRREMWNHGITESSGLNEQVWVFLQVCVIGAVQYRYQVMSLNAVSAKPTIRHFPSETAFMLSIL